MKNKPDDRRDNVEKLQANITHTIQNIELAEETMAETSNQQMKQDISAKNDRRRDALANMRAEIRDEALDQRQEDESLT
ncbi:MAG TPA: small acid-soluble spore protein Tlp [Syntrophomonas sp.]|jgi:small acid-soluble spore protein (thioredoxin-like protein)|nr:small acid-soluble spore protein Tlp [Syntrophomonas sp.]